MRHKPISIEEEGLAVYLNRTAAQHNGRGYDELLEMLGSDMNYTKTQIATAFGVNRDTIYKWLDIYERERVAK